MHHFPIAEILRARPEIYGTLVDLPRTVARAGSLLQAAGVGERVRTDSFLSSTFHISLGPNGWIVYALIFAAITFALTFFGIKISADVCVALGLIEIGGVGNRATPIQKFSTLFYVSNDNYASIFALGGLIG